VCPPIGPASSIPRTLLRMAINMLPSMVINAICPLLLYLYLRQRFPDRSIVPVAAAALFPVLGNLVSIARSRRLDVVGVLMLVGFGVTIATAFTGGDQRLVLVSRSLLTGALGLAALLSVALPRPVMYYFARQFGAGGDPVAIERFDRYWQLRSARTAARVTTVFWGLALLGEFAFRVVIVYTLPVAQVLVLSPIVNDAISLGLMAGTAGYGGWALRRIRREAGAQALVPAS
jgi:hypothetical protein